MTAKGIPDNGIPDKKSIMWQLLLIILPWLVLYAVDNFYPNLLRLLFGPFVRVPTFVALAPFEILLAIGTIIAWKRNFPQWSYTWIGTLYFFGYREIFEIVLGLAPRVLPENPELIALAFYGIVNPLALAFLLAWITRRDWLYACLAAYPFTSIIMAWYTLDTTPFLVLSTSLVLYGFFAVLFLVLQSRTLKFASLLGGTLIVGGGFFLYYWQGVRSLLFIVVRNVLILVFPLVVSRSASRFALIIRNLASRFTQRERKANSTSHRRKLLLGVAIVVLVASVVLTSIWSYSSGQLRALKGQKVHATPEDGMRELVASSYSGVEKVELVYGGESVFDDLWFAEAHVWAASRSDGKGFSTRDYDNPGWYFLQVQSGWVFVPESRFPEIIALGKWLFGLSE